MGRLTRDGTAEPVSRDQILRGERGQGNIHFPCSADHEQDWQPYPVDPRVCVVLSYHLFWTSDLWTHQPGSHRRKVTKDVSTFLLRCLPQFLSREGFSHPFSLSTVKSNFQNFVYPRINRSPLVRRDFLIRVTAPRFELTSQRQKVSRLPTEPPGRPAITLAICVTIHTYESALTPNCELLVVPYPKTALVEFQTVLVSRFSNQLGGVSDGAEIKR